MLLILSLQDGRISDIALLTHNLPLSVTSIACVYRIRSSEEGIDTVRKENCTSFNAALGIVHCGFSVPVKKALLEICKHYVVLNAYKYTARYI